MINRGKSSASSVSSVVKRGSLIVHFQIAASLLGKSIDCPLVFASPNHDYLRFLWPVRRGGPGVEREERNRKGVAPGFHFLTARDFVRGVGPRREERFHTAFGA